MRILIIKTSSMGDVIHNLPVITDIRTHYPSAQIDWVVEESFADIPAMHTGVSNIIPIAFRRWRRGLFSKATLHEIRHALAQLRSQHYEFVLDTQGLLKSGIVALLAHGPRYGRDWSTNREASASLFYQHKFHVKFEQHAVNRGRQLAALALGYPLPDSAPDYGIHPSHAHSSLELPHRYIVGLHATSQDAKLWPDNHWIAFATVLNHHDISLVLPWGSDSERKRAEAISTNLPNVVVLPKLRIAELASVLAGSLAAVGVDTGLIHLAAALDIPTIALYMDTDPLLTGVLGQHQSRYCNLGGIGQIPSTEAVMDALRLKSIL